MHFISNIDILNMGYDIQRFKDHVDEELLCSICGDVFQNPVQAPTCEHVFCSCCISTWLSSNHTCPIDRCPLTVSVLQQLPRIIRNLLGKQRITCANKAHGCTAVVRMDLVEAHEKFCEFDPEKPVECTSGCGLIIEKSKVKDHNCVKSLREIVKLQDEKIEIGKNLLAEIKIQLDEVHQQIGGVKEFILYRPTPGIPLPNFDDFDRLNMELFSWSWSLQPAIVQRWGGVISTPDIVLQIDIKHALIACKCPIYLVNSLMNHCHEMNWPEGLNSLENRQVNRDRFMSYRALKIPGKQAVVILSSDNPDLDEDIISDPGLVFIFENGIS